MFVLLLGVYAAACLFSGTIYQGLTARCDSRIADVIRYEVQRAQLIPYPQISHSKEGRLKLRLWLAERIERINLSFGVNVVTTPDVTQVQAGEHKIEAEIVFRNGVNRWIFLTDKKAVLLS